MSKNRTQIFHALIWLCLSSVCHAKCTQDSALRAAVSDGYQPESDPESDFLITCKVMPNNQQQTIVAFAREIDSHNYTLTILVVNHKTGKVLKRFIDEDPSFGPNGDPTKIEIDTARYIVAPNKRAFGVRVKHSLNSWDSTEDLNLFLEDGNELKEILKGLTVSFSSSHVCYSNEMVSTISMSKLSTENFHNLILTTKQESIEGLMDDSNNRECTSDDPVANTEVKTIRFKDGTYDIYGK